MAVKVGYMKKDSSLAIYSRFIRNINKDTQTIEYNFYFTTNISESTFIHIRVITALMAYQWLINEGILVSESLFC